MLYLETIDDAKPLYPDTNPGDRIEEAWTCLKQFLQVR